METAWLVLSARRRAKVSPSSPHSFVPWQLWGVCVFSVQDELLLVPEIRLCKE